MHNLEIQFNKSIIKKVKSLNFQVDQLGSILFILFCLYENNIDLLDEFDDYNRQKRAFLLYKDLEIKGLVQLNATENNVHYRLTKEGLALVEFLKSEFTKVNEAVTSEKIAVSGVEQLKLGIQADEDVDNWIDEWLEIFPRRVRTGGKLVRSDKPGCIRKMKVFMREYKYDKNTIMRATQKYVDDKSRENFAFMRCAIYFIYRMEGFTGSEKISDLAAECEQILHDKTKENETPRENNLDILV